MNLPIPHPPPVDVTRILPSFDGKSVQAFVLMGSYARGEAGKFSDVDLVRLIEKEDPDLKPAGIYLIEGCLVVISDQTMEKFEAVFTHPERACDSIAGLRTAVPLIDRNHSFERIQQRALNFIWTDELNQQRDEWIANQMVGWIEEVHKGLQGLALNHTGRLLQARFGMTWGMSNIIKVHLGIFLSGDNGLFEDLETLLGEASPWVITRQIAFGIVKPDGSPPTLREQIQAGLALYVLTAEMVRHRLTGRNAGMVEETVQRIREYLDQNQPE
ncbi:MAG: nucleotidyltransferase domain-containing protein [Anaerolineaceae bacterium]|nr:nucleotidyltransferase domain-containing protein [Anaerolineaceae bacterium]